MLTLSVCACGADKKMLQDTSETENHETVTTSDVTMTKEDPIGMPNPFVEGTLEECIKLAGFNFAVPDHFGNYSKRSILAIEGNLIEAVYKRFAGLAVALCFQYSQGSEGKYSFHRLLSCGFHSCLFALLLWLARKLQSHTKVLVFCHNNSPSYILLFLSLLGYAYTVPTISQNSA